ncbi:MAG: hypothetical protein EHM23_26345 [Acidobacteria bacterium]|nr:MAG: hypothetical protein EHM23_26345 [Acidobacteriota bacterium]
MARQGNFADYSRESAYEHNRLANVGSVSGVWISEEHQGARLRGEIYYCENCKFCHTDRQYFDVDHLVPLAEFRASGSQSAPHIALNTQVLCKSLKKGDGGCNQRKGSRLHPPRGAGLAFSCPDIDMNCMPLHLRNL